MKISATRHQRTPLLIATATLLLGLACSRNDPARPPSTEPDRVVLTWAQRPTDSQSVTWRTADSQAEGSVQYTIASGAPDLASLATTQAATQQSLRLRDSEWNEEGPEVVRYHSTTLEGLDPATTYAYRVGAPDAWSEWHHFTTPDPEQPLRFLYFGDAQNGVLSHFSRVLRTAFATAPHADFALYAGDLVNDGHYDLQWQEWFDAGGWLHATLPAVPATGNHEYRSFDRGRQGDKFLSMLWRPQFELPVESALPEELAETAYALPFDQALVVVLDSNRLQREQAVWLDERLAEPARWKIVAFHHPIYSNAGDRDNAALRDLWLPILQRHGVDLVLQGHDHTYSRGLGSAVPTDPGTTEEPGDFGPVFAVSVSGAKQYELAEEPWGNYPGTKLARAAENSQLFQVITVEDDRLSYRAYLAHGELYDGFELLREESDEKRLVEITATPTSRRFDNTGSYTSGHWTK